MPSLNLIKNLLLRQPPPPAPHTHIKLSPQKSKQTNKQKTARKLFIHPIHFWGLTPPEAMCSTLEIQRWMRLTQSLARSPWSQGAAQCSLSGAPGADGAHMQVGHAPRCLGRGSPPCPGPVVSLLLTLSFCIVNRSFVHCSSLGRAEGLTCLLIFHMREYVQWSTNEKQDIHTVSSWENNAYTKLL